MPKTIIADTSCFIVLANIDELSILHTVYGQIITTPEVADEYGSFLPEWVEIVAVKDKTKQELFELQIDKGESSAIALAIELADSLLIVDDYKARKLAAQYKIQFTGTIGVIIKAKLNGIIPSIKPILLKIKKTDFRISAEIEFQALLAAMEIDLSTPH